MDIITDNTLIPIGLVITVIGAVLVVYRWVDNVRDKAEKNTLMIDQIQRDQKQHQKVHDELRADVKTLKAGEEKILQELSGVTVKLEFIIDFIKKEQNK